MNWCGFGEGHVKLIDTLIKKEFIKSEVVKAAMLKVDRSFYCPDLKFCYLDCPQQIGFNATISAPHMHAICLEQLKDSFSEDCVALDIGCGSGYFTACLAKMLERNGKVYGVDHIQELVDKSYENIKKGNPELLNSEVVKLFCKDGRLGLSEVGPFDIIHVGASSPFVPSELINQLKPTGKMIIPIGTEQSQSLILIKKTQNQISEKKVSDVIYVPLTSREEQLGRYSS